MLLGPQGKQKVWLWSDHWDNLEEDKTCNSMIFAMLIHNVVPIFLPLYFLTLLWDHRDGEPEAVVLGRHGSHLYRHVWRLNSLQMFSAASLVHWLPNGYDASEGFLSYRWFTCVFLLIFFTVYCFSLIPFFFLFFVFCRSPLVACVTRPLRCIQLQLQPHMMVTCVVAACIIDTNIIS